tara:strand:+ start:217195 stop:218532 length:1338 start_codon:yes stop_codon:yes gene_type:complete
MTTRREFLIRLTTAPGIIASGSIANGSEDVADETGKLHHPGKVKSIIFYYCYGGPAQGHTFDPPARTIDKSLHPFRFKHCGKSGIEISEVFPRLQTVADDLCLVRSGYGAKATHNEGGQYIFTGSSTLGASLGAWMQFGLGSRNPSLPAFTMLTGRVDGDNWALSDGAVHGGARAIGAGGLPPSLQAQIVNDLKKPIDNLNPRYENTNQKWWLGQLHKWNQHFSQRHPDAPELLSRSESFETARKMQSAAPDAFNLSSELQHKGNRSRYGLDELATRSTGTKLLLARRLVERGVRFVLVPSMRVPNQEGGSVDWDTHTPTSVRGGIPNLARACDQPLAGLIADLKDRGLFEQTLVIWGGEMGRGGNGFMNHNGNAFTWWMAGGGVPGGTTYGATDELGMTAVEKPIHVRDLHATILWMCGLDHRKLKHNGTGLDDTCVVAHELVG